MEPEDQIYINIEELKHPGRQDSGQPVRPESGAQLEPGFSVFKALTVFLALLSLVLLASVVAVAVQRHRDFNQLTRDLANQTTERNQLLMRHENLTQERDQLDLSLKTAELELDQLRKSPACPYGWRRFSYRCYLLSSYSNTWDFSRNQCLQQGADLVMSSSQEELVFLNKLGAQKFWIGLKQSYAGGQWMRADGRPPGTQFWLPGHPSHPSFTHRVQNCAAFNCFQNHIGPVKSWSSEYCSQYLQWVCQKPAACSEILN